MANIHASEANPPSASGRNSTPPLIRNHALPGSEEVTFSRVMLRILLPGAVSFFVNGSLILIFYVGAILLARNAEAQVTTEKAIIEAQFEKEEPKDANFYNDEIGFDPDLPTNYDTERDKMPISLAGPNNPKEKLGVLGAPDSMPRTLPPPPGFGGSQGQGGSQLDLNKMGHGGLTGFVGGMNGPLLPGGFEGRSGGTRERMALEGGGNKLSEAAVARGLIWLNLHQATDGHWSLHRFDKDARVQNEKGEFRSQECTCEGHGGANDIAGTAFGLLPFLGAGKTHKSSGEDGKYSRTVEKGLKYLILKQNKKGNFGGGMYAHGLATIAVCEAYALTYDPALRGPAQRALDFIVGAQSNAGGWSYTAPCAGHDTSVGGWQLMALKSGQMSGLDVPTKAFIGAERWLAGVANSDGSTYGYTSPKIRGESQTMTAVGLLCRQYLGWGPRNPGLVKGVAHLMEEPPGASKNIYYYYYATQVMHHMGGDAWESWNPKMRDRLIQTQDQGADRNHAHQYGSWSPEGDLWGERAGGRLMVTSMAILTLEVYYRHLPLYRRDLGASK